MKKLFLILSFILLLPTLAQAQIYQNDTFIFNVNLPDNWLNAAETEDEFPILVNKIEENNALGIIDIYAENIQEAFGANSFPSLLEASDRQAESMIDILISDLKENYPDVKILSNEKTIINNLPAIVIVHNYSYTADGKVVLVNGYWTVFIENNNLYSLKLQTDDNLNIHMNDFFQMCESFVTIVKTQS